MVAKKKKKKLCKQITCLYFNFAIIMFGYFCVPSTYFDYWVSYDVDSTWEVKMKVLQVPTCMQYRTWS